MKFIVNIALAISLAACATATTVGQTPQQIVFATKSGYEGALIIAVQYKRLPDCGMPAVLPCKDPVIVAQLQKADNVANEATKSAESAVRTPAIGTSAIDHAVLAAKVALQAFTSITNQLKVK